jgi:uncharacterized protein YgiM (DUF1202 family)
MRVRITTRPAVVHETPGLTSPVLTQVEVGTEVQLGGTKKVDGVEWVAAVLPGGQRGFIQGDTPVKSIKHAVLLENGTNVFAAPSEQSTVLTRLARNASFDILGVAEQDGIQFVEVRAGGGITGFIPSKTKVKTIAESAVPTRASAKRNMVVGALWCVGGIVLTTVTYSSVAGNGGTYFVAWGPVIFGGWQLLKGIRQYTTTKD